MTDTPDTLRAQARGEADLERLVCKWRQLGLDRQVADLAGGGGAWASV